MSERFKVSSRRVPDWPPHIPGYTVLMCLVHGVQESAYYCLTEECQEVCRQLSPHVDRLEQLLRMGKSFEQAVADILGASIRAAVAGDI